MSNRSKGTKPEDTSKDPKSTRKYSKPSRGGKKPDKGAPEGYKTTKGTNDISWHTPDAELLRRAAETSWSYQTGEIMDMGQSIMPDGLVTQSAHASQSGFMVIRDLLACGGIGMRNPSAWQQNYTLPTYNAANTLLTEMRARARIRNTYDAPDVFILNMAMANIYAAITFASRLAATVRSFTYKNQYFPEALIKAQGFDPEWMKGNQFRFVTELNVLISEVNKIYVPNRMHIFELISKRFGNYYTEGSDVRDQLYMFTPAFLSAIDFNPTTDYAAHIAPIMCIPGTMSPSIVAGTKYDATALYTGDQLLNAIRFMINRVIEHDATADITGDMENCFGPGERFYLPACDPMAIVVPVFDEEILETIHNMGWNIAVTSNFQAFNTTGTGWSQHGPFTTFQNPADNRIGTWDYYTLGDSAGNQAWCNSESCVHAWLDVHKEPNPEKTFAITRLKNANIYRSVVSSNLYSQIMFTTDLICEVVVYTFNYDANNKPKLDSYVIHNVADPFNASFANIEAALAPFHYRPIRAFIDASTRKLIDKCWVSGETDIWARADYFMLQNMNRISLLTLLGAYNNL